MPSQELLELKKVLEEEKEALMKGAVEEILKWASYKVRLVESLKEKFKEKELSPEEKEFLQEIIKINDRNRKIVEAGLNFIEEAYKFLSAQLNSSNEYGKKGFQNKPKIFSCSI